MFIPLHDTNPLKSIDHQYVTFALIALNVAVFVIFQTGWVIPLENENAAMFAVIPADLLGPTAKTVISPTFPMPERFTLVTYMFLHGGWVHLIGNMLFLWVFGDNVEDAMGHIRFIMFYLMCGIFAGLVHSWMMPNSDLPLIGASGAVAGIISAYLILHPKVKVWVLALWRIPIKLNASWALGIWVAAQVASAPEDGMCDASEVVRERMRFWSALAGDQNRQYQVIGAQLRIPVPVARGELAAALDAVLGNVFRYTPQGTAFEVGISRRDGWVAVRVDDAGPGIPDPEKAMQRGQSNQGSTGLGLDIARRAAQAAGGSVSLDRAAMGGASVVMLLADADATPKQASRFGLVGRLARERTSRPGRVE